MKPSEIKNLIDFISKSGLNEVNIETEQFKLSVKRDADAPKIIEQIVSAAPAAAPQQAVATPVAVAPVAAAPQAEAVAAPVANDNFITITSSMIGTFYKSSGPDSAPFVSVGDVIKSGQTLCIVEAMKLFNEIESEVSGTIVEILIDDATPVEFGTPLFKVDPA